jgi:hypothetical protein
MDALHMYAAGTVQLGRQIVQGNGLPLIDWLALVLQHVLLFSSKHGTAC